MAAFPEFEHGRATETASNALILSAIRQLIDARRKKETSISDDAPSFALGFPNEIIADIERDRLTWRYNWFKTSRVPKAALR